MNRFSVFSCIAYAMSLFMLFSALSCDFLNKEKKSRSFVSNEAFINGLYTGIDLKNKMDVFDYVYSHLEKEVTMYPSENYYYFQFPVKGKTIAGSLTLYPQERDSGILGFGYGAKIEDKAREKFFFVSGGGAELSKEEGVLVKKLDDFNYAVEYKKKKVVFKLYDQGYEPPKKARLTDQEEYVGTTFDESGLQFYLIFNHANSAMYWLLNEDVFVAETFTVSHENTDIYYGDRTEFAFYADTVNNRKILIGVAGLNVKHNNWYDGPFDQLPDNYVALGKIDMRKYLTKYYGIDSTAIDVYGNYSKTARIPVAPYTVYFNYTDLEFVDSCSFAKLNHDDFCKCLTVQRFDTPPGFYDGVYKKYY